MLHTYIHAFRTRFRSVIALIANSDIDAEILRLEHKHKKRTEEAKSMACSKRAVLSLYRNLIRESKQWESYNYRMYALRKVKHEFQQNKDLMDQGDIKLKYEEGMEALQLIKRQVIVGNLYKTRPLIIENNNKNKHLNSKK